MSLKISTYPLYIPTHCTYIGTRKIQANQKSSTRAYHVCEEPKNSQKYGERKKLKVEMSMNRSYR